MDWARKPAVWRIIYTELHAQAGYVSNKELAKKLDSARIPCPQGKGWGTTWMASADSKVFGEYIRKVRKWAGKPGRIERFRPQKPVTPPAAHF